MGAVRGAEGREASGPRGVVAGGGFWPRRILVSPSGQGGLGAGHSALPSRSHRERVLDKGSCRGIRPQGQTRAS